jgi:hypothetical protein
MAIFPPIPALPHAPQTPDTWQRLANRGVGYGYAYPPAYSIFPTNQVQPDNGYMHQYGGGQDLAYVSKPRKYGKNKRRRRASRHQDTYEDPYEFVTGVPQFF